MSWYSQMIKSQELARSKNRREAKRAESQLLGAEFVAQYRLAALDKEKRLIEKELERIRQGVHKPPKVGQNVKERDKHVLTVTSPRQKNAVTTRLIKDFGVSPVTHHIDTAYSNDEKKLYGAIVFLKNNPSALVPILAAHAQSDAYLNTLGRLTPFLEPEESKSKPIVPRYLQENYNDTEKAELLNRYSLLLNRNSPILRGNVSRTGLGRESQRANRDSPDCPTFRSSAPLPPIQTARTEQVNATPRRDLAEDDKNADRLQTGNTDRIGDSTTPRKKQPGHLADKDMQAPRDQISRRPSADMQRPADGQSAQDSTTKPDDKKPKIQPKAMFPAFDPDVYNADGSLRTVHQMVNFEDAWAEAQKARYIRTKEQLERDKELSVKEIFEKDDKTKTTK
ncbi:uncharacterized protein LOC127837899 [Dreissena polymorpha]|uniref:Uncharacterized protein n=1 Tax=Dreissena polymorpha TaxID=45954 RepID=A0A9D4J355_DREPO|nr:uncharacterized protein LOC127837899 [Dreissena polymorpha]XP_052221309.1 uncharacterized protein LOC127837899 [Dreissena polymorpha]KAH3798051.1 hypothetical protein DPMN_151641 [Dreissena polymorpha]